MSESRPAQEPDNFNVPGPCDETVLDVNVKSLGLHVDGTRASTAWSRMDHGPRSIWPLGAFGARSWRYQMEVA